MAGAVFAASGGDKQLPGGCLTFQVLFCTIIASFGGFLFGYDIGISGGVTSMDEFLEKFFPNVYVKKHRARENNYCKFNDEYLQLFTSSLYLAAILASFMSSFFSKKYGRKLTIRFASIFFCIGAILNLAAQNIDMLIIGRLFLGLGLGCANQAVPLFISEISPPKWRGFLNIIFQLLITIGIFIANFINYGTAKIKTYGWRISLGGAAVPAIILFVGSFFIVDTPASLVERGKKEEGLVALKKIRNTENVTEEYNEIVRATEVANKIKHPYKELLTKRQNWPPLICGTILHFFQQFTGMNVIMFYAPVLFQTMGLGGDAALISAVITGGVNMAATLFSNFTVDIVGRKFLLISGAITMIAGQSVVGGLLKEHLTTSSLVSSSIAITVLIFICIFVSAFAWSWGPVGWLVASEIFPLETRNAGYFFPVCMNMLCTFIIAQLFLTMLCSMRAFIFFFFASVLIVATVAVVIFLPETKGIPIEEMTDRVWKKHWFWSRFYNNAADAEVQLEQSKPVPAVA